MPSVNIKATHTALSEAMSAYVAKKIKGLQKFLHEENDIHVELEADPKHRTGPKYHAEITVLPRPGIYAEATGEDLYEAIDLCLPKIKEQLLRRKDKYVSMRRRSRSVKENF